MKKKLIIILTLTLSLLIFNSKNFLEQLVENRLSDFTEHKLKLDLTKFNLFYGSLEFKEIKIENKKNFFNENVFESEKIIINLDPKTYFSDLIIIEKLILYKPKLFFEIKNKQKDNLEILEKLKSEAIPKIYPNKTKDKNFLINQLEINNAVVYIKHKSKKENLPISLSKMSFGNVGNSGNEQFKFQHYKDIMRLILNDVFFRIPDENLRNLIKKNYNIK